MESGTFRNIFDIRTYSTHHTGNCASGRLLFHNRTCADSYSRHYANSLGCAGASIVDCLRQLDTADLFGGDDYGPCSLLSPLLPWTPVIDHAKNGLSGVPSDLISQGSFNRVPTVIGTTNNEGDIFIPALPLVVPGVFFPLDQTTFQMAVMHMWNNATLAAMLETFCKCRNVSV
jgi:carboxylesterase type B